MQFSTVSIHGGYDGDSATGATAVPVYQTAAFAYPSADGLADVFAGRAPGHVYSRISNPTNHALERRLAELENGVGCLVAASGMAAISAVFLALLRPGDEIVVANGIFGGTVSLIRNLLGGFGIGAKFAHADAPAEFAAAISKHTRLLFVETIANPSLEVPDLRALSQLARQAGIPLVVDATATTPALARGRDLGADIVIHSTTKFINGHGTAIGGAIVDTGSYDWRESPFREVRELARRAGSLAFMAYLRNRVARDLGIVAAPQNSFLMLQGLETLAPRMRLHCANAGRLAEWLRTRPRVARVVYPGLADSPFAAIVQRQFAGCGGAILTFDLADRAAAFACLDRFRLALRATNIGDVRTLVLHPASTIFAEYDEAERVALGAGDATIRVSVGIEDFADLQRDFEQALA